MDLNPSQLKKVHTLLILSAILISSTMTVEYQNSFVTIRLVSESASINCIFGNKSHGGSNSCKATITFGENCQRLREIMGVNASSDLVSIKLRNFLEETMPTEYCSFIVTATANTKLLTVEGDLGMSLTLL